MGHCHLARTCVSPYILQFASREIIYYAHLNANNITVNK